MRAFANWRGARSRNEAPNALISSAPARELARTIAKSPTSVRSTSCPAGRCERVGNNAPARATITDLARRIAKRSTRVQSAPCRAPRSRCHETRARAGRAGRETAAKTRACPRPGQALRARLATKRERVCGDREMARHKPPARSRRQRTAIRVRVESRADALRRERLTPGFGRIKVLIPIGSAP